MSYPFNNLSFNKLILCTLAYLQGLMAQNDGLLDGPGYNTTEASTMASCFCLLFSCLQYLFAWFVLFHDHNEQLFFEFKLNILPLFTETEKNSSLSMYTRSDVINTRSHHLQKKTVQT